MIVVNIISTSQSRRPLLLSYSAAEITSDKNFFARPVLRDITISVLTCITRLNVKIVSEQMENCKKYVEIIEIRV